MARPNSELVLIQTGLQIQDLGDEQKVDESGILQNGVVQAEAPRPTLHLLSALHRDTLVLAYREQIEFLDLHLRHLGELKAGFAPVAMSLDETGQVYLLVQAEAGRSLWIVRPTGERTVSLSLAPSTSIRPPLVGLDHRIFLLESGRLMAIGADGRRLWERSLVGDLGGAVVTANDRVLVASGHEILSLDPEGKATVLYDFLGEGLLTPPVLTSRGDLLVASATKLYCLNVTP
jgi:hypothetical protein